MEIVRWNGDPISKPGIYSGVPIEVYHSGSLCIGPSISSSGLRKIWDESPAHYWATSKLNPKRVEEPENEAFTLGRATHHVILGEPSFKDQFIIRPDIAPDGRLWNGNNATCRKWLAEQRSAGRTVLTQAQIDVIRGMALALAAEPLVIAGALNGIVELTMAWQDAETDVWLLSRPDNVAVDSLDFVDLKTTQSIAYDDMVKTLDDFSYQQQGALVVEGFRNITGQEIASFSLYFIEKKYPHCPDLRQLKLEDLERGRKMNRSAIRSFAKCWNAKEWPGPNGKQGDVGHIELSERAQMRIDKRLTAEGLL